MGATSTRGGVIVLTGATSGIGLATAERLAAQVDRLVLQGPESEDAVHDVLERVRRAGSASIDYVRADFTDLNDVVVAAASVQTFGPVSGLINDAGVPGAPVRRVTSDGHERTLQVNYLAMVLLTDLLAPAFVPGARIVNLASSTHEMARLDLPDIELTRGYSPVRAYARSKLAVIMYTRWLGRHPLHGSVSVCLQPGVVNTGLLHAMFGAVGTTVDVGAESVLAALRAPASGGEYYDEGRLVSPSSEARNDRLGDELMAWTRNALVGRLSAV